MFKRLQRNIYTIKNFEQFGMFRNFQFIPKHSNLFSGHFKSVPENIQIVSKHSDLFSEHFKKYSGTLRHFFQMSSETFRLV